MCLLSRGQTALAQVERRHLLVGVGHVLVGRDDGLEAQVHALHFAYGVHGGHHQLQREAV